MLNPLAGAHSSPGPNMSAFEDPSLDEQFRDLDEILSPLFSSQVHPSVPEQMQSRNAVLPDDSTRQEVNPCSLSPHHIAVQLTDLKDIYDKNQKKTLTGSEQRIVDSKVNMIVSASAQIRCVKVYVQRCPEAASKTNDTIDSVYKTQSGDMVYWLDKVEVEERNKWQLIIIVELTNGAYQQFQSRTFRIRTKPRRQKTSNSSHQGSTGTMQTPSASSPGDKDTTWTHLNRVKQYCSSQTPSCIKQDEPVKLNILSSTYSTYYDFYDLPMLWSNPEDVSLDRIVPSLQLFPSVF